MLTVINNDSRAYELGGVILAPGANHLSEKQKGKIDGFFAGLEKEDKHNLVEYYKGMFIFKEDLVKGDESKDGNLGQTYDEIEYEFEDKTLNEIKEIIRSAYELEDLDKISKALKAQGFGDKKSLFKEIENKKKELDLEEQEIPKV